MIFSKNSIITWKAIDPGRLFKKKQTGFAGIHSCKPCLFLPAVPASPEYVLPARYTLGNPGYTFGNSDMAALDHPHNFEVSNQLKIIFKQVQPREPSGNNHLKIKSHVQQFQFLKMPGFDPGFHFDAAFGSGNGSTKPQPQRKDRNTGEGRR